MPSWWEYVGGRFYQEYVPAGDVQFIGGNVSQGTSCYAPLRVLHNLEAAYLVKLATGENPLTDDMKKSGNFMLSHIMGNGLMFETGDGPRTGIGEIMLPPKQNGSSIMPGKINPVIPEVVNQVAFLVIGHDATITAAAEAGQLELNAFEPVLFYQLFESITAMTGAVDTFIENCVIGIRANAKQCVENVEKSTGIVTAMAPYIGYQRSAAIAKESLATGVSVREIILRDAVMSEAELNDLLDARAMTEARALDTSKVKA